MYQSHPHLELPSNGSTIFRYLTLEKFESMLETNSLFFCRAIHLSDQWECDPFPISVPERLRESVRVYSAC